MLSQDVRGAAGSPAPAKPLQPERALADSAAKPTVNPGEGCETPVGRSSRYLNAAQVLPAELIEKIQQYIDGVEIYIPRRSETRLGWGERTGARRALALRNREIRRRYWAGSSIEELMEEFNLGYDSIRKIIYQR